MMNKELKEALEFLELNAYEGSNAKTILSMGDMHEVLKPIRKLIKERFDPDPYKFEDLKVGMWVFDNKAMDFIKVEFILKDKKILCCDGFHRKFEENRFYPITKALCEVNER